MFSLAVPMQIKFYPEFQLLEKEHKTLIDGLFTKFSPLISEFTFTNLYCWRNIYKISITTLNGFVLLSSGNGKEKRFFMPLGEGDTKSLMEEILSKENSIFFRLPEDIVTYFLDDNRFFPELDRDNCDYLFNTQDLISLQGKKYDGKRNLIKKFKSTYKYEYVKLDASNIKECLEFEDKWCSVKDCDGVEGLNDERQAIREMMNNCLVFTLIAGAIKVEGKTCALAIGERLNTNTLVLHVLKADPNMPGLYQVITNEFIVHEGGSFEYVNFEQDLGVPGLRKAKLSYNPVKLINKYTLRRLR